MEFNEKLQELRKQKGLTQEELAQSLFVSRTAISKWESGRGYPNIESLKAIAKFFSVTVDELISTDEALTLAEEDVKQSGGRVRDLVCGALDVCMAMLIFLPLFAQRAGGVVREISLLNLSGQPWLRGIYFAIIIGMALFGVLTLALQSVRASIWVKSKTKISLALSAVSVVLFVASLHPYAAIFAFVLLIIKAMTLIK